MTLGEQIKAIRGDRTVKEVAEQIGVTPQTLSRLENGTRKPSYSLLLRLVRELGVRVSEDDSDDAPRAA